MKWKTLVIPVCVIFLFTLSFQGVNFVKANAMPATSIIPKVTVPEMNVNATVSKADGALWVEIDAEYQMHTIYGYGDSYVVENSGMGLLVDPSPYVTITVTQDILEAHYPFPSNVTNLYVKVDGAKVEWQEDSRGFFHIFDADLSEINWTITPVPRDFVITVHYDQRISKTSAVYEYLGDYAFILPMYGRYGCSNVSAPLYSWFETQPRQYNIQIESYFSKTEAYAIDTRGTLIPLNYIAVVEDGVGRIEVSQETEEEDIFFHGGIVVFNATASSSGSSDIPDEQESVLTETPSSMIVIFAVGATIISLILMIYFRKRKR